MQGMSFVSAKRDTLARLDKAIALPKELTSADGRSFAIKKWAPVVEKDSLVEVCITAYVKLPQADA